jgi:hypothetical protein
MTHVEIVSRLSCLIDNPTSDVLFSIIMQQVIPPIAHRMGEGALSLTADDLQLAKDEVRDALEHYVDEKEIYDLALDVWEISRHL